MLYECNPDLDDATSTWIAPTAETGFDKAFFLLDLGCNTKLTQFKIVNHHYFLGGTGVGRGTKEFTIHYSNDSTTFTSLMSGTLNDTNESGGGQVRKIVKVDKR